MTRPGRGAVFLLTDYGDGDEFAGVTRAVVLKHAPGAPVVDLSHAVAPFDVRAGALLLSRSVVHLGPGVVFGVVDPGVGSARRAVAVSVVGGSGADRAVPGGSGDPGSPVGTDGPRYLVGPDNGLLGWAIDALGGADAAVALPAVGPNPAAGPAGTSFDGRDLFAPVAARLWSGATLNDVGVPIDPASLVRMPAPALRVTAAVTGDATGETGGKVEAEVLWVDRFGNVQLAARAGDGDRAGLSGAVGIRTGRTSTQGRRVVSFIELDEGELGLMVDANGQLSLVCDRRSAATVLGVEPGDIVEVSRIPGSP